MEENKVEDRNEGAGESVGASGVAVVSRMRGTYRVAGVIRSPQRHAATQCFQVYAPAPAATIINDKPRVKLPDVVPHLVQPCDIPSLQESRCKPFHSGMSGRAVPGPVGQRLGGDQYWAQGALHTL